jgi:hypothetical protein
MFLFAMPAYIPTNESVRLAHDVAAAIDATMPRKVAADLIGVSEADLSHMLAGRKPLNILRFTSPPLPEEFQHALLEKRSLRVGGQYIQPELVTLLHGVATVRKHMAKITAYIAERKRA